MLTCFPLFPLFFLYPLKVWISALYKKVSQRVKQVENTKRLREETVSGQHL